ncbi:MAG TPA: GYD domain-containing protein [Planctomycetota bacterium]|nr:GYD domain-containing protein [Planctomycetota bacterium]
MATYIALLKFTQKGVAEINFSAERADEFKKAVKKAGGKVHDIFWLIGHYDGAVIFDCAGDEAAAALLLELASHGCVHTETLRAFTHDEFLGILKKVK